LELRKSFAGKQKSTLGQLSKSRQKKVTLVGAKEEVRATEGDLGAKIEVHQARIDSVFCFFLKI
jgi:hypothetical protein